MAQNARAELQGLPTAHLLPPGDTGDWLLDMHGSPTLTPGHERETLAQNVIILCGERQMRLGEEDSREEKDRLYMLRWKRGDRFRRSQYLQQTFLSLFPDTESNEYNT